MTTPRPFSRRVADDARLRASCAIVCRRNERARTRTFARNLSILTHQYSLVRLNPITLNSMRSSLMFCISRNVFPLIIQDFLILTSSAILSRVYLDLCFLTIEFILIEALRCTAHETRRGDREPRRRNALQSNARIYHLSPRRGSPHVNRR